MSMPESTDVGFPAIDIESRDMLESQVKKGKARKFILVCKGAQIRSLVVFKKGPYGPRINRTRKSGFRGEFYCGVVTGKGVNINLQLPGTQAVSDAMKAEGNVYDDVPCKTAKLRAFFAEEAELKFKPEFTLVTSLNDVHVVDEDASDDSEGASDAGTNGDAAADATLGAKEDLLTLKLREALFRMTPLIKSAIAVAPNRKAELMQQAATIQDAIRNGRLNVARRGIVSYGNLLKQIVAKGPNANSGGDAAQTTATHQTPSPTNGPQTQHPPQAPPPGRRRPVYLTQNQWDAVLTKISNAGDETTKKSLLTEAAATLKAEVTSVKNDLYLAADQVVKQTQDDLHASVKMDLEELAASLRNSKAAESQAPPVAQSTSQVQGPPHAPPPTQPQASPAQATATSPVQASTQASPQPQPQTSTPPQAPPRPLRQPRWAPATDADRKLLIADAERRSKAFPAPLKSQYTIKQLKSIRAKCETDNSSDFGQILQKMAIMDKDAFEDAQSRLRDGLTRAQKYIDDHPDPMIGKLQERVLRRRDYCQKMVPQFNQLLDRLLVVDAAGQTMAKTYRKLLDNGQTVPFGVAEQINQLLLKSQLSKSTQAELRQLVSDIQAADQPRGYAKLAQLQSPTDHQKAEILLGYGCFKAGGGGTSDVRLLRDPDKSIAFAFKGTKGEAAGALSMLQLPNGACATREDLCSTMCQEILAETGIDFGFPKAEVVQLAGQQGALIEGIRGKTVDHEEYANCDASDQQALSEIKRCLNEIPEKITPKSLQKVLVFSTLACQWDCKWGNLMVDGNETNARPIDGGGAFPNQNMVDEFGRSASRPIAILTLTEYPYGNAKFGQTLPQAQQPMDADLVRGILQLNVKQMLARMKTRRDQIAKSSPELAPKGHEGGLVDDQSMDIVGESVQAAQNILRANPQQTLVDFATAYQKWWVGWIAANKNPQSA